MDVASMSLANQPGSGLHTPEGSQAPSVPTTRGASGHIDAGPTRGGPNGHADATARHGEGGVGHGAAGAGLETGWKRAPRVGAAGARGGGRGRPGGGGRAA